MLHIVEFKENEHYMRKGPHPLPVHLGMAAINMEGIEAFASNFSHKLAQNDAIEMVRGIQLYQEHSYNPEALPLEEVWCHGGVRIQAPVMDDKCVETEQPPLLLVPSLINKANILDIAPEKSLLRWLNQNGIQAYLLDWGDFSHETEKDIDISSLIEEKLCPAIQEVSKMAGQPIDVFGYCMGGTLLIPAYSHAKVHIRRMILLAAPWDFKTGSSSLARNVRIWSPAVSPVVRQRGCLPSSWVQALFASLDPKGSAQKFIRFASMDQMSSEAKLFVSVEDWLNDGVDLPGNIARHCIDDWFMGNKLALEEWSVGDDHINMADIDADILIMASHGDQLVPFDCAMAIKESLVNARVDTIEHDCGHIGLIVGRNAIENVWQPMLRWLQKK